MVVRPARVDGGGLGSCLLRISLSHRLKQPKVRLSCAGVRRLSRDRLAYGRERLAATMSKRPNRCSTERPRRLDWSLSGISLLSPDAPPSVLPLSGLPARTLQPKLAIGSVDDPLEHEADRVADQVMRMPDSALSISPGSPQLSRKCAECEEEDKKKLQMKSTAVPQAAGRRSAPDSARPNMMTRPKCMPCPNWRESAIQVSVKQTRCLASTRRDPR